jgi:hypothetical protein
MKKPVRIRKPSNPLRRQAGQLIRARHSAKSVTLDKKARSVIYELQVHRIDLGLYNNLFDAPASFWMASLPVWAT